jgi:dinuclear metal center YbgI/SA1388 family protein
MKIKDIAVVVEQIAPLKLAQSWDNVGMLVGDPERPLKNLLLTIDITQAVIAEAVKLKTDLIVSYHPVIWDGLKQVLAKGQGQIVHELIRRRIAVFSIHTALDAVIGGVNDGLAEMLGIQDAKPIGAGPRPDRAHRVDALRPTRGAVQLHRVEGTGKGRKWYRICGSDVCEFQPADDLPAGLRPTAGRNGGRQLHFGHRSGPL